MTTSQKLWLGFGSLTALLAVSTVVTLLQVRSMEATIERQITLTQPLLLNTLKLDATTSRYLLNVRSLLQVENSTIRQELSTVEAEVQQTFSDYKNLASTAHQEELASGFNGRWEALRNYAEEQLRSEERPISTQNSDHLLALRLELEDFMRGDMQQEAIIGYEVQREATKKSLRTISTFALVLLVAGVLFSLIIGGTVGRAVIRSEHELVEAHDMLEEKVEERTAELRTSTESLSRSNRELEQFASVASHDLQEPLRKIQAFGDRLQSKYRDDLGEQGKDYLDRILASASRMRRLIDDLLSFSRVASKAQPFVQTDLVALLNEVASDLEGRLQQTGGRIEIGALPTLEGDPMQLQQLFQNLIANGLKFHRPDVAPVVHVQGRILRNARSVLPLAPEQLPMCEITIQDNGIGFEEIYLDRIFNVFQRLHGRNEFEGTGMGLAICRKIVERHHGHITAKSIEGEGSTFIVRLPLQQPQNNVEK